jgi:hypothetical protein
MARRKRHNPEKRAYKGKSYRKGGAQVRDLKDSPPNRAHYAIDSSHTGEWKQTAEVWCVFHARRLSACQRARALGVENGMSRPIERPCTACSKDAMRCEHDCWPQRECSGVPGNGCGRDLDHVKGGSW